MLVARGKLLDASALPGFVCTEGGEILGAALYDICCGECELAALISLKGTRTWGAADPRGG